MDFKKFGWYLVWLGLVLGLVSAYYAWLPYQLRWVEFDAIVDATKRGGYSPKLADIREQFEAFRQRMFGFGVGAAITLFLGIGLIQSGKSSEPDPA